MKKNISSVISFFLVGANPIDLFYMQKQDRADYIRRKTGRIYSIKIEPECNELINKHKGKELLLNCSEKYANPENE